MGNDVRPKKQKAQNAISAAIDLWFSSLDTVPIVELSVLQAQAPKRWVVYEPMILLPSGSFSSSAWTQLLGDFQQSQLDALWLLLLKQVGGKGSKTPLTHLAINEGIPLHVEQAPDQPSAEAENILRSPSGLRILYGDFGPAEEKAHYGADFDQAFWVSTKQNGIHQTWAPRWTMFSRGNVKEKARLLDFHALPALDAEHDALANRFWASDRLSRSWAVDLYAGIGYFVFSYAKLGFRVLCWELNPWSVEGLRRGALRNGWSVKVLAGEELQRPTPDLLGSEVITVFLENNKEATRRIRELRIAGVELDVAHVNCGLLPSSKDVWRSAWNIVGSEGWLHLHENVGTSDIKDFRDAVQETFSTYAAGEVGGLRARVEHIEQVKTFAPDVWHCVFDVHISNNKRCR